MTLDRIENLLHTTHWTFPLFCISPQEILSLIPLEQFQITKKLQGESERVHYYATSGKISNNVTHMKPVFDSL